VAGWWFFLGTPVSSTNKTDRSSSSVWSKVKNASFVKGRKSYKKSDYKINNTQNTINNTKNENNVISLVCNIYIAG
jgi:hypothetical protein